MEIFKYTPNWSQIVHRQLMKFEDKSEPAKKIPIPDLEFELKLVTGQKKKAQELCHICKKDKHLPSMCPQKPVKPQAEEKSVETYNVNVILSPTTVKLMNIPTDTSRGQLREILRDAGIIYESLHMVGDKNNRETFIFKGLVYIELPTKEEAERCLKLFDGLRMDIQIVSAMVVESRSARE
ncbi:hypothetical protein NEHOM01_2355 [Nematocida homosporus]|uniref:uncharacterized protein n=1 Tax=Nematocida homosporus TaxID=1912981 RepID=UPI00222064DB|nr:uncharacterized protein NEHOM01_2355 [Nematocida homosporus]KAI5187768.1 hypothetical protein NEHOM01_2355 [Nematocida homosporus]